MDGRSFTGWLSLAALGVVDPVGSDTGEVVACSVSTDGVEVLVSAPFTPQADGPLGAPVLPETVVAPAALSCAPRSERTAALNYWVARRCSEFLAYRCRRALYKCASAYPVTADADHVGQSGRCDRPRLSSTNHLVRVLCSKPGGSHHRGNIHADTKKRSSRRLRCGCGCSLEEKRATSQYTQRK